MSEKEENSKEIIERAGAHKRDAEFNLKQFNDQDINTLKNMLWNAGLKIESILQRKKCNIKEFILAKDLNSRVESCFISKKPYCQI